MQCNPSKCESESLQRVVYMRGFCLMVSTWCDLAMHPILGGLLLSFSISSFFSCPRRQIKLWENTRRRVFRFLPECEDICSSNSVYDHTVFNSLLSFSVVVQPLGLSWTNSPLDPTWCRAVIVSLKHELLHIHPLRLRTLEHRQSSLNNSP